MIPRWRGKHPLLWWRDNGGGAFAVLHAFDYQRSHSHHIGDARCLFASSFCRALARITRGGGDGFFVRRRSLASSNVLGAGVAGTRPHRWVCSPFRTFRRAGTGMVCPTVRTAGVNGAARRGARAGMVGNRRGRRTGGRSGRTGGRAPQGTPRCRSEGPGNVVKRRPEPATATQSGRRGGYVLLKQRVGICTLARVWVSRQCRIGLTLRSISPMWWGQGSQHRRSHSSFRFVSTG